jgi:hypothetical protein
VCFTRTLRFFHNSPPRQNYLSCLIVTYRHYLPRLGFHGTVASQIIKKVQNLRVLSAILGNAQILHVLDKRGGRHGTGLAGRTLGYYQRVLDRRDCRREPAAGHQRAVRENYGGKPNMTPQDGDLAPLHPQTHQGYYHDWL